MSTCVVLFGFHAAEATSLKKIVEQAKKPPEDQETVPPPPVSQDRDHPRSQPPHRIDPGFYYRDHSYWQPTPVYVYEAVSSAAIVTAGPSVGSGIESWHAGFKSLYLQPADGVLADLGGAGIEFGMSWSTVSTEAGVFW